MVDPGTGSTFRSLELRGYILVKYEQATLHPRSDLIVYVRLTTQGRKLVRDALGLARVCRNVAGVHLAPLPEQFDVIERAALALTDEHKSHLALMIAKCLPPEQAAPLPSLRTVVNHQASPGPLSGPARWRRLPPPDPQARFGPYVMRPG